ncbi:XRE family transcriptional regulator [Pacificitalea manganoxidans]|uniref:XRE family transcriptional regulator n=1 Tax=Pacificitalea manganoxidans TaxID=1411902 RepID=A0A291LWT1_9RHOB|nr:cupin domain-containing protein [Pacificitalea manganoxidans]ATI41152.1 XRE family transcriptional regulator [Pacificitalea manganoxidans]MAQ44761.1 XRE family transcriptional regulator [Actibacterium sp.]MDR6308527.1 transcriptional regulator with XRE-family HTH domain [Pacificitalea manganoxidans]|tara:strand:+ start:618 stop:1205 length:588 start_codon:yes stop_codon:yes gene_type:complete
MDDPNFDIGARLFAMRKAAQLSQRQLAERAGVPHAQISIIEQNKSSPSIATLRKILSGLNLSMGDFFEGERAAPEGPFFHPEDLLDLTSKLPASGVTDQQGRMAFRQIGDARRHNLQILHEVYEKGADTGENMLDHFSTEGGYVIEGALELTVGEDMRVLHPGDSYLFDSRIPHRFRNVHDGRTVVISACTPPYL